MGTAIKHPVPYQVKPSFVIFDISAQMSKITNDGLTRSGTGYFTAVQCTRMATVGIKGLILENAHLWMYFDDFCGIGRKMRFSCFSC